MKKQKTPEAIKASRQASARLQEEKSASLNQLRLFVACCDNDVQALAGAMASGGSVSKKCWPMALNSQWLKKTMLLWRWNGEREDQRPSCSQRTPLMLAAASNALECLDMLLEAGADPLEAHSPSGRSALWCAAETGSMATFLRLREVCSPSAGDLAWCASLAKRGALDAGQGIALAAAAQAISEYLAIEKHSANAHAPAQERPRRRL